MVFCYYPVGPFLIHCATKDLYLCVRDDNSVVATKKKRNAAKFYLKQSGNPKYPYEFYICNKSCKSPKLGTKDVMDIDDDKRQPLQYLQTSLNLLGYKSGPLRMVWHARDQDIRLVLRSAIRKPRQHPVSLSAWMSGSEMCFIQCARRIQKNGYIAVKRPGSGICCVCSKSKRSAGTLFQIIFCSDIGDGDFAKQQHPTGPQALKRSLSLPGVVYNDVAGGEATVLDNWSLKRREDFDDSRK